MKKLYTIVLSVILFVTNIHSSEFKVPKLVYKSQTFDYDFRIVGENFRYTFVPILRVTDITKSPVKLKPVYKDSIITRNNYNGPVVYECGVDERGNLSSVFIVKSLNHYCDSLVLNAIKSSEFRAIKNKKGEGLILIFFVTYLFDNNSIIHPIINGTLISNYYKQSGLYLIDEVDKIPEIKSKKTLYYPQILNDSRKEGKVIIKALVNEKGYVIDAIIKHSDEECIYVPALEMTYQYYYSPAIKDGKPVSTIIEVLFEFKSNSHLLDKYLLNRW